MKTFLKVLSVLMIIGAVISIILGIVTIGGGGLMSGLGLSQMAGLTEEESMGAAALGVVAIVLGLLMILAAVFSLLTGIFGWIGAKGNAGKLKAALVMGWISLVLSVISAVYSIANHGDIWNALLSVALPALFVIAATSVKKEQGAQQEQA